MGAFDGIDPTQEQAIRRALAKEVRGEVEADLEASLRRKLERDIRAETRREVLQEVAEQSPTDEERDTFTQYVGEVRLDAYAQATLASDIAGDAREQEERAANLLLPAITLFVVAFPLASKWGADALGGYTSSTFIATTLTLLLAFAALLVTFATRTRRARNRAATHERIASDFLIIAERAKAFAMVHAERIATSRELGDVLENLRRSKEKCDRTFHPNAGELESARALVRPRIEADARQRIAIDDDHDAAFEADLDAEIPQPRKRRRRS